MGRHGNTPPRDAGTRSGLRHARLSAQCAAGVHPPGAPYLCLLRCQLRGHERAPALHRGMHGQGKDPSGTRGRQAHLLFGGAVPSGARKMQDLPGSGQADGRTDREVRLLRNRRNPGRGGSPGGMGHGDVRLRPGRDRWRLGGAAGSRRRFLRGRKPVSHPRNPQRRPGYDVLGKHLRSRQEQRLVETRGWRPRLDRRLRGRRVSPPLLFPAACMARPIPDRPFPESARLGGRPFHPQISFCRQTGQPADGGKHFPRAPRQLRRDRLRPDPGDGRRTLRQSQPL